MAAVAPTSNTASFDMTNSNANSNDNDKNSLEAAIRKSIATLNVQRTSLETETEAIISELTAKTGENGDGPPMGIDTPLVDSDGYPRGDIDVYRARTLRGRLAVIRNDHKDLMSQLDVLLTKLSAIKNSSKVQQEQTEMDARKAPKPKPKYDNKTGKWVVMNWDGSIAGSGETNDNRTFENLNDVTNNNNNNDDDDDKIDDEDNHHHHHRHHYRRNYHHQQQGHIRTRNHYGQSERSQVSGLTDDHSVNSLSTTDSVGGLLPFARIAAVADNSPAHYAGLHEDDIIIEFGTINQHNHNRLKALTDFVPQIAAEQQSIEIILKRRASRQVNNIDDDDDDDDDDTNHNISKEHWETKIVSLRPRPWNGRGLIGCHIVPYSM